MNCPNRKEKKKIAELAITDLIDITILEDICMPLDSWEYPRIQYFTNMIIKDTIIIEFYQKKKDEAFFSDTIVFYFNYNSFIFYSHIKNLSISTEIKKIKAKTIKSLIEKKYDISL
ncbi:hypothetical protein ACHRVZ_17380 [Flavobacterium sp. FlaQc-57]|uniref:hypothetical protein n=1 Tax=Flavobacterium sp. FlaQc-57 TaxID=3374186 RepID=UPI0037580743